MSDTIEVRIPNIGDFHDLPIIAVLVKAGDTIALETPLVELESEKATMEVPSPAAGVVAGVAVKLGDKVSEGATILTLRSHSVAATPPVDTARPADVAPATPVAPAAVPVAGRLVELRVPDIGDFSGIPVIEVLVAPGDRIEKETSLVTLESEKATMDVPASEAGIVRELRVVVGDRVSMGSAIALVETSASDAPAATGSAPKPSPAPAPAPPELPAPPSDGAPPAVSARREPERNGVVHASPSIRRFARELGVDLHAIAGSGPHARVTRDDVQAYVKGALAAPRSEPPRATGGGLPFDLPAWPKPDFAQYGEIRRVPLSRLRTFSGRNLHRNWLMIPHVTNDDEADMTELEAFRKTLNAENATAKVTLLAFVVKACTVALKAFPDVNSSLDGDELVHKHYYNIGFAADTPNGLVVPVLKNADRKGILELASESAALAAKARDGKLGIGDMSGATFTISSLGGIGGTSFTPIVNAPEVAILGLSRSAMKPVWDGSAFVPRLMLPLSLSYDHRVIDGALAARFNAFLVKLLSDLRRSLL